VSSLLLLLMDNYQRI